MNNQVGKRVSQVINVGRNVMNNKLNVSKGEIYFIPLFLSGEPSSKSFHRYDFNSKNKEFIFFRIIDDQAGSGILIEVFNFVGGVESLEESITLSPRLFDPIYIAGDGISKKRWRKIGETKNYDKEKDSSYSSIKFLIGPPDDLRLWCNGVESPFSTSQDHMEIEEHIIWTAKQTEKRVLEHLKRY